jgi:pyruvate/2-oxoglutarate dehydrogenase complex dihydrolipoamide acyltransferase (E2) component
MEQQAKEAEQPERGAGRTIPLSLPRRIMTDVLASAQRVPSVPVQRRMNVATIAAARALWAGTGRRVGWCAIFTKAYALTARRFPELRRAFLSVPRPRLYEHPCSIASLAIEREYQGEKAVLWGHVRCPEQKSLPEVQAYVSHLQDEAIERISLFRRALQVARLPWPLRRVMWWTGLNVSGAQRAKRFGTFGVSTYSSLGADSLHPLSPLTGTLNYGPIAADGSVAVRLVYDHRVLDGATVARALAFMEDVLNGALVAELEMTRRDQAA